MIRITADDQPSQGLPPSLRGDRFLNITGNGPALWVKLAAVLGINSKRSPKLLGAGSRGMAYDIGGKVLKISMDHTEARASAIVRDSPDPAGRVVRIERVFILDGEPNPRQPDAGRVSGYAIVMEKLAEADLAWADMADWWPAGLDLLPANVESAFQSEGPPKTVTPEQWQQFRVWLAGVAAYLESVKIEFTDLWADNIMKRPNGDHVVIDLGHSVSPGRVDDMADDTIASLLESAAGRLTNGRDIP